MTYTETAVRHGVVASNLDGDTGLHNYVNARNTFVNIIRLYNSPLLNRRTKDWGHCIMLIIVTADQSEASMHHALQV